MMFDGGSAHVRGCCLFWRRTPRLYSLLRGFSSKSELLSTPASTQSQSTNCICHQELNYTWKPRKVQALTNYYRLHMHLSNASTTHQNRTKQPLSDIISSPFDINSGMEHSAATPLISHPPFPINALVFKRERKFFSINSSVFWCA